MKRTQPRRFRSGQEVFETFIPGYKASNEKEPELGKELGVKVAREILDSFGLSVSPPTPRQRQPKRKPKTRNTAHV